MELLPKKAEANKLEAINLLVDGTENASFMAEKTFFLTLTMVSTSEKIFCATDTTVSVD